MPGVFEIPVIISRNIKKSIGLDLFNNLNKKSSNKDDLSQKLLKKGIETRRIWRPLNLQKHLSKFQTYKIINAQKIYEKFEFLIS